jgi:hypothetical protein
MVISQESSYCISGAGTSIAEKTVSISSNSAGIRQCPFSLI